MIPRRIGVRNGALARFLNSSCSTDAFKKPQDEAVPEPGLMFEEGKDTQKSKQTFQLMASFSVQGKINIDEHSTNFINM